MKYAKAPIQFEVPSLFFVSFGSARVYRACTLARASDTLLNVWTRLDGERVWTDTTAVRKARWSTAHFVKHHDKVWIFNEQGELILSELSPEGFKVIARAPLIEPTRDQLNRRGGVTWSHPAFANGHVFIRNDNELIKVDLRLRE